MVVIIIKRKRSLPLLLPTEMKWEVQLRRGGRVSTTEAARERESRESKASGHCRHTKKRNTPNKTPHSNGNSTATS